MPPEHNFDTYADLLLFLATAGVIVPLFSRLKVSPVLGFLLAGVMLGPFGLGALAQDFRWLSTFTFTAQEQIAQFAELGIAFLLFMIGLELSWGRLVRMRRLVFGLGGVQVVVTALVLGTVAFALGQPAASAIVLGAALAMSSTALVLPALRERKRLKSPAGRAAVAVLLFQDLAVAPLLFMVAFLGSAQVANAGLGLLYALAPAAIALAILVGIGWLVLRPLFRLVASTHNNELFVAVCLLIVIGMALITQAAGQSMALGAFVAGLLLAETEYRRVVEATIQPFQGLLLGLLFVSIGAGLDLAQALAYPLPMLAVVLVIVVAKFLVIFPAARAFGLSAPVATEAGLVLSPAGEFALVLIGAAVAGRVVPAPAGAVAMVAVTLSMFAVPLMAWLAERVARRQAAADPRLASLAPDDYSGPPRIIIVGHGRVGELVGQMLTRFKLPYVALDTDPALVTEGRTAGRTIHYGDATNPELLRRCGIATSPALVVTTDNPTAVETVIEIARLERPDLIIIARARDARHAAKLYRLSATEAVPETIEASLQLAEAVLINIGVPMGEVIASVHEKRDEFRRALQGPKDDSAAAAAESAPPLPPN